MSYGLVLQFPTQQRKMRACQGYYTIPLSTETTTKRENQAVCEAGHACVGGVKTKCEDGTWADAGSSVCTPCPQYEEQDASLGYSSDSCVCKGTFVRDPTTDKCSCEPGFTLTGETCSPCEIGRFKDDYGVHSCSRCEVREEETHTGGRPTNKSTQLNSTHHQPSLRMFSRAR